MVHHCIPDTLLAGSVNRAVWEAEHTADDKQGGGRSIMTLTLTADRSRSTPYDAATATAPITFVQYNGSFVQQQQQSTFFGFLNN